MSTSQLAKQIDEEIIYPDSDGQPMADNTKQFDWINHIVSNLKTQYIHEPNVFIAGDLLWYPIEGDNKTRRAPDAMVAIGRPKGDRGSYKQWLEDDIAPQVVFEIRSPGNTDSEMEKKFRFYQDHQVEEYYLYDPDTGQLKGWIRGGGQLRPIVSMNGWKSKQLGIRFELKDKVLYLYHPNGKQFSTHDEEAERAQEEAKARQAEKQRADAQTKRAQEEAKARQAEKQRADAEAKARQVEKQRADAEAKRAQEEAKARQAEKQRADAEAKRAQEEAKARQAEKQRADAEAKRAQEEAKARQAEKQRADAEAKARQAEKQRADAEAKAHQAEKQRAESVEAQLAHLQSLLAQKGISLDETLVNK